MNATEFLIRRGIYYDRVVSKGVKRFLYSGKKLIAFISYGDKLSIDGWCWADKEWIK